MITVVDYGMGNLRNVRRAFEQLGQHVIVTSDPKQVAEANRLVLPGVGAFGEAAKRIDSLGLRQSILGVAQGGRPVLGICLGMQLLFDSSQESPGAVGLGLLPGEVLRFGRDVKVPHIGWNDAVSSVNSRILADLGASACFYFVHSFFVPVSQLTSARTSYGVTFSAAVERSNVFGVQFHPEKSQSAGMDLLRRFVSLEV